MWKKLNKIEREDFENWAYKTFVPGEEINTTWHPVIQTICHEINAKYWAGVTTNYVEED